MFRVLAAAGAALALLPAAAQADGYRAGAGMAITTPPLAGTVAGREADAQFAPEFANCPAQAFPDRGTFALQEPFKDLNGNGTWDSGESGDTPPEPFCDANGNGRWDGIYTSGQIGVPADRVNDDIDARAFAIARAHQKPVVYVSVVEQGLFENYTDAMRTRLRDVYGVKADMVVSANHNESSPDTVGIYGPYSNPAGTGTRSGIDEYYMRFLEDRVAKAAAQAVGALEPARLYATQVHVPDTITQRYSTQFPTFDTLTNPRTPTAIDDKIGVLQARRADGSGIFTVMSYAAHNQEMGRVGPEISGDWPIAFARAYEHDHPADGLALFLVGDNGSQEDPSSNPEVIPGGSENHGKDQYLQAQATGAEFARIVGAAAPQAQRLRTGDVSLTREAFCVPLENLGFAALAAAGEFGQRQAWVCDPSETPIAPNGPLGREFRTYVGVTRVGPDLELIDNPGEAFPALMLGSPFTKAEESCDQPNPEVPTWHAGSTWRFQVGLADDMIGYLLPAWSYVADPPQLFPTACQSDANGQDHKLEDEGVGPVAANAVADRLSELLDRWPDPLAHIETGRYVTSDGKLTARPTTPGVVGIRLQSGRTVTAGPDAVFMDYDGQPQDGPDVTTRGMLLRDADGNVVARDYVSVFDSLG
jgi:hypothetical protein